MLPNTGGPSDIPGGTIIANVEQALQALMPEAIAVADIPTILTITVSPAEGQTRAKYVGFIDDAKSVQVSLYLPEGMAFPKDGFELVVGGEGFNVDQSVRRTRKGSTKLVWGNMADSESFGAAAFLPRTANVSTVVAVLAKS